MASHQLARASPSARTKFYLDTSAVFPVAFYEAAKQGGGPAPPKEVARMTTLRSFIAKARAVSADLRTSLLALEEIAAKTRNELRRLNMPPTYRGDWHQFRTADPAAADAVDAGAQSKTILMLQWTVQGLTSLDVKLEWFPIPPSHTLTMAESTQQYHELLLKKYSKLDAMDALHIVVGVECGAKSFISFDRGWQTVVEIDVYS